HCDRPHALRYLEWLIACAREIKEAASAGGALIFGIPRCAAGGEQLLNVCCDRTPVLPHALDCRSNTGCVPHLERPHFPVEASAHGKVDFNESVRDLRNAVCSVCPQFAESRPVELRCLVFCIRVENQLDSLSDRLHVLCHLQQLKPGFAARLIIQGSPV